MFVEDTQPVKNVCHVFVSQFP